MLKRMSQNDEATIVFHEHLAEGWMLRHEELFGLLGSAVDFFQESYHRRAHSSTG